MVLSRRLCFTAKDWVVVALLLLFVLMNGVVAGWTQGHVVRSLYMALLVWLSFSATAVAFVAHSFGRTPSVDEKRQQEGRRRWTAPPTLLPTVMVTLTCVTTTTTTVLASRWLLLGPWLQLLLHLECLRINVKTTAFVLRHRTSTGSKAREFVRHMLAFGVV